MSIGIEHFLTVGALLFCLGLAIALSKRNAIGVLMGVELMLNAVNLTLITFSRFSVRKRILARMSVSAFSPIVRIRGTAREKIRGALFRRS